jgi:hypothetical protein
MAVANEWTDVDKAFERLGTHHSLHPTLAAMKKLVDLIRQDPAFADVHPIVSMASLMLSRGQAKRRVCVAWHDDGGYKIYAVDPPLEFSEPTTVREDAVVDVLREYLDKLGDDSDIREDTNHD